MCTNQHLISDLADLVVRNIPNSSPVIVAVQKSDGTVHVPSELMETMIPW
jgi:hypothetical protein